MSTKAKPEKGMVSRDNGCDLPSLCTSNAGSSHVILYDSKRVLLINARDKESLLEEVEQLRHAITDQEQHLKLHKEHHNGVCKLNRFLHIFLYPYAFLQKHHLEDQRFEQCSGTYCQVNSRKH